MFTGFEKMAFGGGPDQHELNVEDKILIGIENCDLEQLV